MIADSPRNTTASSADPKTLIDERPAPPVVRTTSSAISQDIPVHQVRPSPTNPRVDFDDEAMAALTDSIAEHGVLEPIVVLRRPDANSTYELIAGHRRWLAAGRAGLDRIPARVMIGVDGAAAAKLQAIENLQRQDLNPVEEAQQFRQLADAGLKQAEIGRTVGKSQPYIANRLRILDLPSDVRDLIRAGKLTAAHGVSIARFSAFPAIASAIAALAVKHSQTVRDLEKAKAPHVWDLQQANILTQIHTEEPPFDTCKSCPYKAYRADGYSKWCLKPEHAEELRLEHAARKLAEARAQTAQIKAEHPDLTDLTTWSPATQVQRFNPPEGCTDACPCAAQATKTDYTGNLSLISVCTNRERYEELQRLDKVRKQKAAERTHADHLARALAALDDQPASRIALVGLAALNTVNHEHRAAASKRQANGQATPTTSQGYEPPDQVAARITANLKHFRTLEGGVILAVAAEAMIRHELHNRYLGYHTTTTITDWLLGETPAAVTANEDDEDANYPRESDLLCERCGEPILRDLRTIESAEYDRRVAAPLTDNDADPALCLRCDGQGPITPEPDARMEAAHNDGKHTTPVDECLFCHAKQLGVPVP